MFLCSLLAVGIISANAGAERAQKGNLVVSLKGGITPITLPRHRLVPVAAHLAGHVQTTDQSPVSRVNWIRLEMAWSGVLDTRGLPVCPKARIISADTKQALERCADSAVGRGRIFARIFVPNQRAFDVHARLVAFNGRTKGGRPAVLVHSYSSHLPVSFVIPFGVHRHGGRTVLIALIRRSAGPWPHVANFQVVVSGSFKHHGEEHSYLKASCPVPKHFTAGFLSFARATYAFADGREVKVAAVRTCRAR